MKKVSLQSIIESVIREQNKANKISDYEPTESDVRMVRRAFERLIERLGTDKSVLKNGGTRIEFDDANVSFMKVLIAQLYSGKGIIADFANARNKNRKFSSSDVHELIQALLDAAEKEDNMDENELQHIGTFLSSIFGESSLRSMEYCHNLIDALGANMSDLTYSEQARYLCRVERILKKVFVERLVDMVIRSEGICEILEAAKEREGVDKIDYDMYDPEISYEYTQRDLHVLEKYKRMMI